MLLENVMIYKMLLEDSVRLKDVIKEWTHLGENIGNENVCLVTIQPFVCFTYKNTQNNKHSFRQTKS